MLRRLGAFLLVALPMCLANAQAPPHSVEELLRLPIIRDVSLSPDGKRLAIVGKLGDQRDLVTIVEIDKLSDPSGVRKFSIGKEGWHLPLWVMWANDRRLLVGIRVGIDASYLVSGRQVEAIDADGGNPVALFADAPLGARYGLDLSRVVDITPDDPDHVIMAAWNRETNDLFQVDVNTGAATLIVRGRSNTLGWETEGGHPALRYDINFRGTELSIFGHSSENDEDWPLVVKIRLQDLVERDWEYAGDAPGIGKIYIRARRDGTDTQNIYVYDLRTKATGEAVAQVPGFDLSSAFAIGGEYAGAVYVADTTTYLLKDPKLQSHWNGTRKFFKNLANVKIIDVDRARTRMLLHVVGPQSPGDYYTYDLATASLKFIASDKPWLEPERLAPVETLRSPMRDGTAITSYLTRPGGSGALPLVVMPHGGPEMRDSIDYDPLAQAFATQGWLVLQPNFRGSAGYGLAFTEAGYRQWAKRMQDDVTDAVNDLVKRGIADPKRIAIYGASYGGYAALMGAVLTPDLYRAAVSVAGVTDLRDFISFVRKEDGEDSESYRYWLKSIGDPKQDRDALDALSPRYRAAEINIPVLLMHGKEDDTVPARESEAMKKALQKAGKSVRYIPFERESHSEWETEDEIKQIEEAINFLKPVLQ